MTLRPDQKRDDAQPRPGYDPDPRKALQSIEAELRDIKAMLREILGLLERLAGRP